MLLATHDLREAIAETLGPARHSLHGTLSGSGDHRGAPRTSRLVAHTLWRQLDQPFKQHSHFWPGVINLG